MRILFCCTVVPTKYENNIKDVSVAGNRFLNNLIKELRKKHHVRVLSYIGYHVDDEIMKEMLEQSDNTGYYSGCKNRISQLMKYRAAIREETKDSDLVIAYNPIYAWFGMARGASRYKKKSVLILADYSPYESDRRITRRIYAKLQIHEIHSFSRVVALSEKTKDILKSKQEFVCMEGGLEETVLSYFSNERQGSDKYRVMYAGMLKDVTGVDILLQAFESYKNDEAELYVSGYGQLEGMVRQFAGRDKRIKYLGRLEYEEYLEYLGSASVLINPRNMRYSENQYNFPSKVIEYLATGKPIISTKFSGWEKFSDFIIFCDDTVEEIQGAIEQAAQATEENFNKRRKFAKNFLWKNQIEKIIG